VPVDHFFDRPQAAAKLKHEILSGYLRPFVQKVGSRAPGNTVAYLDGYAGPGQYEDQSRGSPAIAIDVADLVAHVDHVIGHLVEADDAWYEKLKNYVATQQPTWTVYHGRIENYLDQILASVGGLPLFAFLDPFGLGLPLSTLTGKLLQRPSGRRGRVPTEVLLNFSLSGLRRNAGHLTSSKRVGTYELARETIIKLGGKWWHSIWVDGSEGSRELQVLDGYLKKLKHEAPDWHQFIVPVSDRWKGKPDYFLIFLTQHLDGIWLFNQSVSSALERYRLFCLSESGQLDLEPLSQREQAWVDDVAGNIRGLLLSGAFAVLDKTSEVYGHTLGFAREKHVRKAIKQLHAEGVTSTTGIGDIPTMRVVPLTETFQVR
jgi:three-Cys-motif partner protein